MRIGLIGVGTIGSFLADRISKDPSLELCFVLDTNEEKTKNFPQGMVIHSVREIPDKKPDLVVEAASAQAVKQYAETVLRETDFLILSVSALADKQLEEQIKALCKRHGTRLFVPSGAIAGIDMLKAMQPELMKVELVSRKPPKGWGRSDKEKTIFFEGPARKACPRFPRNVNISATIALNGIGFDRTMVKLVSDPTIKANWHTLRVKHRLGELIVEAKASPTKNPKTSSTAAYSAFELIKRIQSGINLF